MSKSKGGSLSQSVTMSPIELSDSRLDSCKMQFEFEFRWQGGVGQALHVQVRQDGQKLVLHVQVQQEGKERSQKKIGKSMVFCQTRGGGVSEGGQRVSRIILGPPKHVLHMVWSWSLISWLTPKRGVKLALLLSRVLPRKSYYAGSGFHILEAITIQWNSKDNF